MSLSWNNAESFLEQLSEPEFNEWNMRDMLAHAITNFRINMTKLVKEERELQIESALESVGRKRSNLEQAVNIKNLKERIALLEAFEEEILAHNLTQSNSKMIVWNGHNNQLTDLFRQLKELHNPRTQKPFISNSYEEIAAFLIQNFECFKDTKLSTVLTTLKKRDAKIKQPLKVSLSNQSE